MTILKSSAELVSSLWERYADRFEAKFPSHRPSKRYGSQYLITDDDKEQDTHALTRWTNPGERANWRIPVHRIPRVAEKLGASEDEMDELMLARLAELEVTNGKHDALVAAAWGFKAAEKAYALTPDEEVVLKCYRRGTAASPYPIFDTEKQQQLLTMLFERLTDKSLAQLDVPDPDSEVEMTEEEAKAEKERRSERLEVLMATLKSNEAKKRYEELREMKVKGFPKKSRIKKLLEKYR